MVALLLLVLLCLLTLLLLIFLFLLSLLLFVLLLRLGLPLLLRLFFLRFRLRLLVPALIGALLQACEHGAGERQVVGRVIVGRFGAQHVLVGKRGSGVIPQLEAGITQVVTGRLGISARHRLLKGLGRVREATGAVERDTAAVGIGKPVRGGLIVAVLEVIECRLLGVLEPAAMGGSRWNQGPDQSQLQGRRQGTRAPGLGRILMTAVACRPVHA